MAAKPPDHHNPAAAPTTPSTSLLINQSPPSKLPIDFSPPLIAMVVVAAAAFLLVTYSRLISRHLFPPFLRLIRRYRRWRRLRRLRRAHFPPSDLGSPPPPYESSDGFYVYSPYGLDESVIKTIPLTIFELPKSNNKLTSKLGLKIEEEFNDCAVCLLEFEDGDYIRTLPLCSHSFHVDCIDMWLQSHATCPLCRSGVFLPPPIVDSPLTPLMASRIRPSLDEGFLLESIFLEPLPEGPEQNSGEIQPVIRSDDFFSTQSEDQRPREHDFLLKRSYSFGFERSFPSERIVLEAATTPYHQNRRRSFFWTKRPSSSTPFSSIAKSRVFSFRLKSPGGFFRRKTFFPFSESSASFRGSSSSRRNMKSLASPLFGRQPTPAMFSSSRMRCGDPEALLSPERYGREVNI